MKKIMNLLLGVLLLVTVALAAYMMIAGGSWASANANIVWTYVLLGGAIVAALGCAVWGMIQHPQGIKGTLFTVVGLIVLLVVTYLIANGHHFEVPNLADGGVFPRNLTVVSDTSVLIAYVALAGAFLAAIFSEVYKAIK